MKYKNSRKKILDKLIDWDVYSFKGSNSTLNRIKDMLSAKPVGEMEKICSNCLFWDCQSASHCNKCNSEYSEWKNKLCRPTLKPIAIPKNIKYLNSDLKRWTRELTDRINLLSEKGKR